VRRLLGLFLVLCLVLLAPLATAQEPARLALLIGNQGYTQKVGPLKNPHHDVDLVAASLTKVGFKVTILKDASYKGMDNALKRFVTDVRRAGRGALSFFYYSGHGVANKETQINYLIPVDVADADDDNVWFESLQQNTVIDLLSKQAPFATHYLVFDASRNELNLTGSNTKALHADKGFVPLNDTSGLLIAYATAPRQTAWDVGDDGGPYAKALAAELVNPGIEAVSMFRNVQVVIKEIIGQDPWLSFPSLPPIYFAGRAEALTSAQPLPSTSASSEAERAWPLVKETTNIAGLDAYIRRYGDTFFGDLAKERLAELKQQAAQQAANAAKSNAEPPLQSEGRPRDDVRRLGEVRREAGVAAAKAKDTEAYTSVPVYFGTDRKQGPDQRRDKLVLSTFGADPIDDLILGEAIVTVPNEGRDRGTISLPQDTTIFGITISREKEDTAKHFTLLSVDVLSKDKFIQIVKQHMAASNTFRDQALLFIHGYNVTFQDALYRTAQIAFDLDFDGVPFLFSWPSRGGFQGYRADLDRANGSKIHLRDFLELVIKQSGAKKIHIIAHSMGAGPMLEVLEELGKNTNTPRELRINEIVLAAPDIDAKNFEDLAKRITPWAGGITLYASNNDVALKASKGLTFGGERAGFVGERGPIILNGVDTIDVSAISTNWFGWHHAEPMERRQLIKDIKRILETGLHPPDKRFDVLFKRVKTSRGIYWKYVQ
jgi:esterase/lipase superfamily enzyme